MLSVGTGLAAAAVASSPYPTERLLDACITRPDAVVSSLTGTLHLSAAAARTIWRIAGADLTHRIPVGRRRGAAAGDLRAVLRLIDVGLHDLDAAPVDVELVGDDHRQHVLDALPDLRVLRLIVTMPSGAIFTKASGVERSAGARAVPAPAARRDRDAARSACRRRRRADLQEGATSEQDSSSWLLLTLRRRPAPSRLERDVPSDAAR